MVNICILPNTMPLHTYANSCLSCSSYDPPHIKVGTNPSNNTHSTQTSNSSHLISHHHHEPNHNAAPRPFLTGSLPSTPHTNHPTLAPLRSNNTITHPPLRQARNTLQQPQPQQQQQRRRRRSRTKSSAHAPRSGRGGGRAAPQGGGEGVPGAVQECCAAVGEFGCGAADFAGDELLFV